MLIVVFFMMIGHKNNNNNQSKISSNDSIANNKAIVDKIWLGWTLQPGGYASIGYREVDVVGELIKKGTVSPAVVGSSANGRLPAYLACYDYVVIMRGLGDEKTNTCVFYIDNPSRETHSMMHRGRQYIGDLENIMAKYGFSEDRE